MRHSCRVIVDETEVDGISATDIERRKIFFVSSSDQGELFQCMLAEFVVDVEVWWNWRSIGEYSFETEIPMTCHAYQMEVDNAMASIR